MKNILDLNDLFTVQLREVYDAEIHLMPYLDNLAFQIQNPKLTELVSRYERQTSDNHWVLKQVFNNLFTQKRGEKSSAIQQMITDTESILAKCGTEEIKEAAIVLNLQHIIHYKIATYGALCTYTKFLKFYDEGAKLHELLKAEKLLDRKLAMLADGEIDRKAVVALED